MVNVEASVTALGRIAVAYDLDVRDLRVLSGEWYTAHASTSGRVPGCRVGADVQFDGGWRAEQRECKDGVNREVRVARRRPSAASCRFRPATIPEDDLVVLVTPSATYIAEFGPDARTVTVGALPVLYQLMKYWATFLHLSCTKPSTW